MSWRDRAKPVTENEPEKKSSWRDRAKSVEPTVMEELDPYFKDAAELGDSAVGAVMEGVGKVSGAVDRVTGAPARAAIGAAQDGKGIGGAGEAFLQQFLKPAETAPTGKDIAAKAGMSTKDTVKTPFRSFDNSPIMASPAGLAGGALEAAADPSLLIPAGAIAKGMEKGVEGFAKMAPRFSKVMSTLAKERAVKAALGENAGAIRKLAKVKGQGAGDVDKALARLHTAGGHLLEPGAGGGGWPDGG